VYDEIHGRDELVSSRAIIERGSVVGVIEPQFGPQRDDFVGPPTQACSYAGNCKLLSKASNKGFPNHFKLCASARFGIKIPTTSATVAASTVFLRLNSTLLARRDPYGAQVKFAGVRKNFGECGRGFSMNQVQNGCTDSF